MNQSGYTDGAAKVCDDYTNTDTGTGAYSDWYLPSKDELNKLYLNRAAIGGFGEAYWSSSEQANNNGWAHYFSTNTQGAYWKDATQFRVRAIRAF